MGFESPNPFSRDAGVDLTNSQYCAVTIDSTGRLVPPAAGGSAIGILYTHPTLGKSGVVYGPGAGIRKARYGGAIVLPAALKVDALGRFVTASAADIAAGSVVAIAIAPGVVDEIGSVLFFGGASTVGQAAGFDDIVLGTTAPSSLTAITFVQVTGNKTGALGPGASFGQAKRIIQSVAAGGPVGAITGAFKTLAGVAATTLALGTATGPIADFVWDGAAWRATSAIGGAASSLT